jgi:hypothetical protein
MTQEFKLVISTPKNAVNAAKTWEFTHETGNVIDIIAEKKKDTNRIGNLQARIEDPGWKIFSELPDIAYWNVPIKLYFTAPGTFTRVPVLAWQGKLTQLQAGYPSTETITLTAHDKTIDARRKATHKTFKNLKSTQIAKKIADSYGWSFEDASGRVLENVAIDYGPELSEWDHLCRALRADGLYPVFHNDTLSIQHTPTKVYASTFQRGEPPVIKLDVTISHIRGPGQGGDKRGRNAFDPTGSPTQGSTEYSIYSIPGFPNLYEDSVTNPYYIKLQNAEHVTHRRPVRGASTKSTGAHAEDRQGAKWSNKVDTTRRRKDSATLLCVGLPDIELDKVVNINGWGAKTDGTWYIDGISHIVGGAEYPTTTLSLTRTNSKSARKQLKEAFDPEIHAARST